MKSCLVLILSIILITQISCNKHEAPFVFEYVGEFNGELIEHNEFGTGEVYDTVKVGTAEVAPIESGSVVHVIKNIGEVFSFDGQEIQENMALETEIENNDTHYTYNYSLTFKADSLIFKKEWESIGENGHSIFRGIR